MTKNKSFLDSVKEATAGFKHAGGNWFDRLPADTQEELIAVRKALQEGKVFGPKTVIAKAIIQLCQDRGLRVCRVQGVCEWLRAKQ